MLRKVTQFFHNQFRKNEAKIHELNYLFWECTLRCNLNCLHCGSDCTNDSTIKDMPFDDFLNAIQPLKERYKPDSITVVITGGEPLLRKDLVQCGKKLRQNGFRWAIVTNGFAYTPDIHAQLVGAGMGAITLSLDGLESSHNWLRNNSTSFSHAVRALDLITSSKRLLYDVVTCVNTKNINQLAQLKEFLISKKVKAWRLFTISPIGRAANIDELQLNSHQLKQVMDFICIARSDKRIDTKFSCEAYVGKYEKKVRDSFFFCRAGINIGSVLIDGSICACPNIAKSFVQGNIYTDKFLDVWDSKFEVMRNRTWTKTGDCLHCKEYKHCEGGAIHLWNNNRTTCLNKKLN